MNTNFGIEQVKITLTNLSAKTIIVSVCETGEPGKCKTMLEKGMQVNLDKPVAFTSSKNHFRFILRLDRIGRAGENPFTRAAYITFEKYKNKQSSE